MIENVKCPECRGPMTSRKNGLTGQLFWGCNAYPKCRGTRNTDGDAPGLRQPRLRDEPTARELPSERLPSERQRLNDRRRW